MGENAGDIELSSMKIDPTELPKLRRRRRRRTCCKCCGACVILLIFILLVLVILYFTVFKPKNPRMHIDKMRLEDFDAQVVLNIPPSVKLNVTLGIVVSVTNPNKVGFKFYNSTAYMFFRDREVGIVSNPAGTLGAGKTVQLSSSLELLADRLLSDTYLYLDFLAGSLPFSIRVQVGGRINILNIFKHHVDTSAVCDVAISLPKPSKDINDMQCKYDIKF